MYVALVFTVSIVVAATAAFAAEARPATQPAASVMSSASDQSESSRWLASAGPIPEFRAPATREAWEKQRSKIRETLWKLLGDLPPRPQELDVKTIAREDRGDYLLEKFTFDNAAGATVPGYLLLPKNAKAKSPAILYCHWHGGQYDIGKEELFGTNATPVPAGPALAKAGYVVVAIDAYGFGERNGHGPGGPAEKGGPAELTASKFNLWLGRTLWGMIVRDDLIALDYLCSRPEVDASRIAVTGISMGATRTWWIMALDERPKTGIAVACLTRYQDLIAIQQLKAHGIYYFVPGMLKHFDTEAVVALAAPGPMLFMTGEKDAGSPADGVRKIESAVSKVYALYGEQSARDFRSVLYPDLGHVYTPEMWAETNKWLTEKLK
jgi:dienelactone hydrolase